MALLDDEENRAAFGIYPNAFRGDYGNPQDAANLPLDVLRGRLAGLLGMFGDVVNQPIAFTPARVAQLAMQGLSGQERYKYPDTERFLKTLPLAPTSRAGEVAGQAGSFVPLNPAPLVRAGVAGAKALAPTAARMTERYMQRQGFMPGVVPEPPSGLLTPEIPAPKPQAPVSDLGFYSAAEQAAMNLQRGKSTGQSFLNDLMKASDVKKDELKYTGLDEFLRDKPNVTRQEVQDFIAGNRVDVQERQLGGALSPEMQTTRDALSDKYKGLVDNIADAKSQFEEGKISYAQLRNTVSNNQVQIQALDTQINEINKTISPTKYQGYQLPGGDNYREILLTLPSKPMDINMAAENYYKQFLQRGGQPDWSQLTSVKKQEIISSMPDVAINAPSSPQFSSSHFNEPNILAHMRVNDRVDADGKKMLLIEEVQSDWHQAGREAGYNTGKEKTLSEVERELNVITQKRSRLIDEAAALPDSEMTKFKAMNEEIKKLGEQATKLNEEWTNLFDKPKGVPDAPFKDTWYQLALKRALKEAVDKGYDRIGLTTGAQQVERYKMSNEVNSLAWRDAGGGVKRAVSIDLINGDNMTLSVNSEGKLMGGEFKNKSLSSVLGKDLAKKIMSEDSGNLMGNGLNIGGEGMKKYYDEIYPAFLEKQGKKYGAQVGETRIKTGRGVPGGETVRYLDITPEMRKAVQKGQPLFTAAPIGGIGTGLLSDEQRKELSGLLGP